jgi:hypothetical protein
MASGAVKNIAGAGVRGAVSGSAALAKAGGAAGASLQALGGGAGIPFHQKALAAGSAFTKSLALDAGHSIAGNASSLSRSLVSRPLFGGEPRYPGEPGVNSDSAPQRWIRNNDDGSRRSLGQLYGEKIREGQRLAASSPPQAPKKA